MGVKGRDRMFFWFLTDWRWSSADATMLGIPAAKEKVCS